MLEQRSPCNTPPNGVQASTRGPLWWRRSCGCRMITLSGICLVSVKPVSMDEHLLPASYHHTGRPTLWIKRVRDALSRVDRHRQFMGGELRSVHLGESLLLPIDVLSMRGSGSFPASLSYLGGLDGMYMFPACTSATSAHTVLLLLRLAFPTLRFLPVLPRSSDPESERHRVWIGMNSGSSDILWGEDSKDSVCTNHLVFLQPERWAGIAEVVKG